MPVGQHLAGLRAAFQESLAICRGRCWGSVLILKAQRTVVDKHVLWRGVLSRVGSAPPWAEQGFGWKQLLHIRSEHCRYSSEQQPLGSSCRRPVSGV